MKNTRGFLLAEETLKVIIAVIALIFLAYLLYSLYNAGKGSKETEFAKNSVQFLVKGLNAQDKEIQIYNPKGWQIISWPLQGTGVVPKLCSGNGWNSCICICAESNQQSCDESGFCAENKQGFSFENIEIAKPPVTLEIDYSTKKITKK